MPAAATSRRVWVPGRATKITADSVPGTATASWATQSSCRSRSWIISTSPSWATPSRAAGRDFVGAGPTRELDQVFVELEPGAVVAVDPRRRDETAVARDRLLHRAI